MVSLKMNFEFGNKGIVSSLEVIAVIAILFISFDIFFPDRWYNDNWDDAQAFIASKDIISTLRSQGKLHEYISDESKMNSFLENLYTDSNFIFWYTMDGVKDEINIACDCTVSEISYLGDWLNGVNFNERNLSFRVCYADVSDMSSNCIKDSDLLIIWGDRDLSKATGAFNDLSIYASQSKGIIQINDYASIDDGENEIFGIVLGAYTGSGGLNMSKAVPSELKYDINKFFHGIPTSIFTVSDSNDVSDECETEKIGYFKVRDIERAFWTCNDSFVFFNTMGNSFPYDTGPLSEGDLFYIDGMEFNLSYIKDNTMIQIKFLEDEYIFSDFTQIGDNLIIPTTRDPSRVVLRKEVGSEISSKGSIINNFSSSRTAWISDFSRNGLDLVGDDQKHLLKSIIIWASRKTTGLNQIENIEKGYSTSYVEVIYDDFFEIRKYDVGVGYPF